MSYRADRQARLATRRSLHARPLRPQELSAGAVKESHVSEGSVSEAHLDAELSGRVEELETEVAELRSVVAGLVGSDPLGGVTDL